MVEVEEFARIRKLDDEERARIEAATICSLKLQEEILYLDNRIKNDMFAAMKAQDDLRRNERDMKDGQTPLSSEDRKRRDEEMEIEKKKEQLKEAMAARTSTLSFSLSEKGSLSTVKNLDETQEKAAEEEKREAAKRLEKIEQENARILAERTESFNKKLREQQEEDEKKKKEKEREDQEKKEREKNDGRSNR